MDHSEVKHLPQVDHTPAELDGVSKALLRAADYIETVGHWRGGESGGSCALLALIDGAQDGEKWTYFEQALGRLADALNCDGFDRTMWIYRWNDTHSKDEVVAKLRAVALGG